MSHMGHFQDVLRLRRQQGRLGMIVRGMVLLAAPLATGCAPMIAHGPSVHPGFSAGASATLGTGPTYENGDDPGPLYLGAGMVHAAYGWRPVRGDLPALRVGLQGPAAGGAGADVYVQAPRAWLGPVAAGAGFLAEGAGRSGRVMPYAQVGVENAAGFGTHVVVGQYDQGQRQFVGYTSHERATVTWLSAQLPASSGMTIHVHAGLARGHVTRQNSNSPTPYIDEDRWVGLGGLSVELHRPRR